MSDLRRRPHRRVLTATIAAAVLLAACGGDGAPTSAPVTAPPVVDQPPGDAAPEATSTETAPDAGATAPATSTELLGALSTDGDVIGDSIDLAAAAGRPVVAWFWAPWCTICRAEAPTIADIAATYTDEIVLIGVPGRGTEADIRRFVDDTGTGSITHIADLGGDIWSQFGVFAQPAFAFITPDGDTEVFVGSLGERALIERIEALTGA